MRRHLAALLALAALLLPSAAHAEERILRFFSDIAVQQDGGLLVSETITVRAEGNQIRRGIYRDFPTRYKGRRGDRIRVDFDLIDVTRDGRLEPSRVEANGNGVRIWIGQEDVFLDPGDYRYVIRYRTSRQLGRFKDFDELYWNVTGNGWIFPIDEAEARITLPSLVRFGQRDVYTGRQGASGKQARVTSERPGEIMFRTTGPLGPYEGLTVAAAFPKGVVAEVTDAQRRKHWLADYGPLLAAGLVLAGVLLFYFHAWRRAGRDPRPGTVVPLFSPPDNLSPAAMRYVWKMTADNRAFAAALVDLGVKGHVKLIEEEGGWFSSDKTRIFRRIETGGPIDAAEQAMLRELAMSGESISMEQENHAKFQAARKALDDDFKQRFEGQLFHRNWGWAIGGLILFVAGLWLAAAAVVASEGLQSLLMTAVPLGAMVTAGLLAMLAQDSSGTAKWVFWIVALIFGVGGFALGLPVIPAALGSGWWQPLAIPLIALPLVISAFWWMSAPTLEGRRVLDRIAGFRQYLSIAEGERLDRMTAPKDTPELFEKYLPYAIALGVENRWADRFHGVLAAASATGNKAGFAWYAGSGDPWDNPGTFVSDVGSSLANSVSSASTAPGSSSGSGGGGSSGGGGGGGGGGGW